MRKLWVSVLAVAAAVAVLTIAHHGFGIDPTVWEFMSTAAAMGAIAVIHQLLD